MFQRTSALCFLVLASMGAACAVPTATEAEDAPDAPVVRSDVDQDSAVQRPQRTALGPKSQALPLADFSLNPFDLGWKAISMFVVDPLVGYVKGKGDAQIMELLPFADATDTRLETLNLKMDALLAAQAEMKDSIDGLKTALGASTAFLTAQNHGASGAVLRPGRNAPDADEAGLAWCWHCVAFG